MKAEHRKELHTNALADRLGHLYQGVKSGPKANSAGSWIIGILTLVTLGAWFFAGGTHESRSSLWVKLDTDNTPGELDFITKNNPDILGTIPGRTIRFQRARLLLQQGLENLVSPNHHRSAVQSLVEARSLYGDLAPVCLPDNGQDAILAQEAMLGAAKAEEALAGVPQLDNPSEGRGSLDEAVKLYRKLAEKYPNSFAGEAATKRLEVLEDVNKRQDVDAFYATMRAKFQDLKDLKDLEDASAKSK